MIKTNNRFMLLLVAFLLLPFAGGDALAAQNPRPLVTTAAASFSSSSALASAAQEQTASGLPERAQPPRTLRAYWHLFIAFAVTWVLVFGYALTIGRRFSRLEEELRRVAETDSARGR